jgi:hypothetical protein
LLKPTQSQIKSSASGYEKASIFILIGVIGVIGVKMEYVTKKIPKSLVGRINVLKARMQIKTRRKVTEGEVISIAINRLENDIEKKKRYSLANLAGTIKKGKKSNPNEIDRIVYGV